MNYLRNETYVVRQKDTLWKIASLHQVGVMELINANPQISDPDVIYPGQVINIPSESNFRSLEQEIIRLVNQERANQGIPALEEDWEVSRVARFKSQDMIDNDKFFHNSPVYGSPFQMLRSFGIRFTAAAENIAYGQRTAQQVMNTWMASSGHRANILNRNYNKIGVGVARDPSSGQLYFTQIFIRS
ncbi:MAG TPA: LysM peptidoglycan-binding domain-containing protein [Acholeplasmataceae bacterium]|nr:LysM peptidoglycan-binding domain-containing protein [Acholeplasmataceae bacterium]